MGTLVDLSVASPLWVPAGTCMHHAKYYSSTLMHALLSITPRYLVATTGASRLIPITRKPLYVFSLLFSHFFFSSKLGDGCDLDCLQVEIFRWLYESWVHRKKWTYAEVIGEMLLLQFTFIYTTTGVFMPTISHVFSADHSKRDYMLP
jgi:hypothetical protein